MNFKEYWAAHVKKNPKFADEDAAIQIKVGMLRKLLEEAHGRGFDHATKTRRAVEELFRMAGVSSNGFNL
jgi:hypothetical protein